MRTAGLMSYLPILMLAASVTGVIVGALANELVERLSAIRRAGS